MLLKDKIATVTGGSAGLGRAVVEGFVAQGAKVIVAARTEAGRDGGMPVVEAINAKTPGMAKFVKCDVSQTSDLQVAVDAAEDWGGLDIMVNNAGILEKEP
ncbi:MAG: SDR family NAD(P)-dependent oxidoreductase, partial [Paracoccaceae bacterium]